MTLKDELIEIKWKLVTHRCDCLPRLNDPYLSQQEKDYAELKERLSLAVDAVMDTVSLLNGSVHEDEYITKGN